MNKPSEIKSWIVGNQWPYVPDGLKTRVLKSCADMAAYCDSFMMPSVFLLECNGKRRYCAYGIGTIDTKESGKMQMNVPSEYLDGR